MVQQVCFVGIEVTEAKFVNVHGEPSMVADRNLETDKRTYQVQGIVDYGKADRDGLVACQQHRCGRIGWNVGSCGCEGKQLPVEVSAETIPRCDSLLLVSYQVLARLLPLRGVDVGVSIDVIVTGKEMLEMDDVFGDRSGHFAVLDVATSSVRIRIGLINIADNLATVIHQYHEHVVEAKTLLQIVRIRFGGQTNGIRRTQAEFYAAVARQLTPGNRLLMTGRDCNNAEQ